MNPTELCETVLGRLRENEWLVAECNSGRISEADVSDPLELLGSLVVWAAFLGPGSPAAEDLLREISFLKEELANILFQHDHEKRARGKD